MEHIYLSHHGIKGQKWGVRRFQLKNGKLTMAGKKRYSEDAEDEKKKAEEDSEPKKRSVKDMSDQELRDAINRAQLEESYKRYYEAPAQQKTDKGRKMAEEAAKKILLDPAMNAASKYVSNKMNKMVEDMTGTKGKSINDLLKTDMRKLSPDELSKVVNYKDMVKRYNEHAKNESTDSQVDRMQQERMDKRKRQIEMEQQELNLRMKRATVEKMEEDRRNARESAAQKVSDVVKDVAKETVKDIFTGNTSYSEERAKATVDKYLDEPLMLPKPKDDLEHSDIIEHHGIKGQRWGVRRYQNEDGTLTTAGKKRQERKDYRLDKARQRQLKAVAYQAGRFSRKYDKEYDKLNRKVSKRIEKDLDKHGALSRRTEKKERTVEQLKRDRDDYRKYAKESMELAKKHTANMLETYADRKVSEVKTYEKKGREYVKGKSLSLVYLQKVAVSNKQGDILYQYEPMLRTYMPLSDGLEAVDIAYTRYRGR